MSECEPGNTTSKTFSPLPAFVEAKLSRHSSLATKCTIFSIGKLSIFCLTISQISLIRLYREIFSTMYTLSLLFILQYSTLQPTVLLPPK